jgi:2-polyprenyl-6-methoxyphenol hydroxylase-like FAD-dependent oxidoreductase
MAERVVIIGGSIAGLACALALSERGFDVTVVERDPSPPDGLSPADSAAWRRRGAPHAPQPHVLTARLRRTLREWRPDLVEALLHAGVGELSFAEMIHPAARAGYRPAPEDEDIGVLLSRRTTLELVMRRYVEAEGAARILAGARVTSLVLGPGGPPVRVRGVRIEDNDGAREIAADVVIDASGRTAGFADALREAGASLGEETHVSQSAYYTRHYRLRPGRTRPGLYGIPGAIFADFTVGVFAADNDAITVTVSVFKDDPLLFGALNDERVFEAVCRAVPMVAPWIDPDLAEPTSPVLGWANMDFQWRTLAPDGAAQALGFFFAGDTALRSNPKYGRGCTCAVLGARMLAEAMASTTDPAERARRYEAALTSAFREEWEALLAVDRADHERFLYAAGLGSAPVALRLRSRFQDHLLQCATLCDAAVQRALLRGFYALDSPSAWTRQPVVWLRIARAALFTGEKRAAARLRAVRPSRQQMREWIEAAA